MICHQLFMKVNICTYSRLIIQNNCFKSLIIKMPPAQKVKLESTLSAQTSSKAKQSPPTRQQTCKIYSQQYLGFSYDGTMQTPPPPILRGYRGEVYVATLSEVLMLQICN